MKFKRILKRKVYPTWISIGKLKECKIQILYIPSNDIYHFHIDYKNNIIYSSLDDNNVFKTFQDCAESAEQWILSHK